MPLHYTHCMTDDILGRLSNDKCLLHEVLWSNFLENPFNPSLPSNITTIDSGTLDYIHILQIVSMIDIKTNETIQTAKSSANRMLKLELTDGAQTVFAYEYRRISQLDLIFNDHFRCLAKIAIFNNPVIKKGTIWLLPENVKVLFEGFTCLTLNTEESILQATSNAISSMEINNINNFIQYNQKISSSDGSTNTTRRQSAPKLPEGNTITAMFMNAHKENNKIQERKPQSDTPAQPSCIDTVRTEFEADLEAIMNIESVFTMKTESDVIVVEDEWDSIKSPHRVFGEDLSQCSFFTYLAHSKHKTSLDNPELLDRALIHYSIDTRRVLCDKFSINHEESFLLASMENQNKHIAGFDLSNEIFYGTITKLLLLQDHLLTDHLWLIELLICSRPLSYLLANQDTLEKHCAIVGKDKSSIQIKIATVLYNFVGYVCLSVADYKGRSCLWLSNIINN